MVVSIDASRPISRCTHIPTSPFRLTLRVQIDMSCAFDGALCHATHEKKKGRRTFMVLVVCPLLAEILHAPSHGCTTHTTYIHQTTQTNAKRVHTTKRRKQEKNIFLIDTDGIRGYVSLCDHTSICYHTNRHVQSSSSTSIASFRGSP